MPNSESVGGTPQGEPEEVVLRIGDGAGDVDAFDLSEFMMLLRGAYVAAQGLGASPSPEALRTRLADLSAEQTTSLFSKGTSGTPLLTRRITHQSPVEIILIGMVFPLTAVAVLLGGKVSILGVVRIELPYGLIDAATRLRELFSRSSHTTIAFGARERRIKLTPTEFAELMAHDSTTADRGGFQRFLAQLQFRVNQQTRELTLYPREIDRIFRHGSQPKKGGFQSRIRKMFGSHFDWPPETGDRRQARK